MQFTIPKAIKAGEAVKAFTKSVDADFLTLPSPAVAGPTMTPGQILEAMSATRGDYVRDMQDIWQKTLGKCTDIEATYQQIDDVANSIIRCCDHMLHGTEIGTEHDPEMAISARTIRRAHMAGVVDKDEINNLVIKCREDLRDSLTALEQHSGFSKMYRRAARKALMSNTDKAVNALLSLKDSSLSATDKTRLKAFQKRMTGRQQQFGEAYRKTYYEKRGYKKGSMPTHGFSALRALT